MDTLPQHADKRYSPINACIYCGATEGLSDEHIIPLGLGGRWLLPQSSCKACAAMTARFEQTCLRTILGPLRLYYDLPSRRRSSRPDKLKLKVKFKRGDEWSYADIDQREYPFLVLFPFFLMPDELSGYTTPAGKRGPVASHLWIRGAFFGKDVAACCQPLCDKFGFVEVMPEATVEVPPFCQLLAKVAHAYAVAELGHDGFEPFLRPAIREGALEERAQFIGGLAKDELPGTQLHELSLDSHTCDKPDIVSVRVRLLAPLGTPTYYVAVGRRTGAFH